MKLAIYMLQVSKLDLVDAGICDHKLKLSKISGECDIFCRAKMWLHDEWDSD